MCPLRFFFKIPVIYSSMCFLCGCTRWEDLIWVSILSLGLLIGTNPKRVDDDLQKKVENAHVLLKRYLAVYEERSSYGIVPSILEAQNIKWTEITHLVSPDLEY